MNRLHFPTLSFSPQQYFKILMGLAVPVMLEQLSQIFLGTVDAFFAGQISDNAIAAINVTNLFMNLFGTVFNALGIGIMVSVSNALGQRDTGLANRMIRQSVILGTAVGLGFGFLNLLLCRPFLYAAGARDEILSMGISYYLIVCLPCVFMCLTMILSNGLKAAQNTSISMQAALIANVANAVLDALFIRLGMGVFGLGLATSLSRLLNLGLLFWVYIRGKTVLKLSRSGWKREPALMSRLIRYSGPIMLTQLVARFAILIHGALILHLSNTLYVANSITTQINEYACIPSAGFEAATATMVSNSFGANRRGDAGRYTLLSFLFNALCVTILSVLLAIFALPLAGLFTQTVEIRLMIRQVLRFMVLFEWTSALSHVLTSAVQGTGDSRYPLYVTALSIIFLRLGVGYLLAYSLHWNLIGIWTGIVLDFLLRGILLGIRFFKNAREPSPEVSK